MRPRNTVITSQLSVRQQGTVPLRETFPRAHKAVFVARQLFRFDEGEDEEFIDLKAVYCLTDEYRTAFEAFLKINRFTDFYLLDEAADPQVWAAVMELRFYRLKPPQNNF